MRALVTGASGLIGSNIVRALLARGHAVRALVRPTSSLAGLEGLPIEVARGDVLCSDDLDLAVQSCDSVFHAAAIYAYWGKTADELERLATEGTANVLKAARGGEVTRVVLTSSSVVFGYELDRRERDESAGLAPAEGEAPYVRAKRQQDRLATELALDLGIDLVTACPTVSVGPQSPTLGPSNAVVVAYLRDPWRTTYPGGCNIVSARDVGLGHVLLAEKGAGGERYVLGGENLEWSAIHGVISELCGVVGPRVVANHTACYVAAAAEEIRAALAGEPALTTREQAKMVGRYYWYRSARARGLGFRARPARTALAEAIAWLAAGPNISREVRTQMRLSDEVYAARAELAECESRLRSAA